MPVQPHLPEPLAVWLRPFLADLTTPTWCHALTLVAGAILAPGRRTVAAMLRVMGLGQLATFTNYHRVLNRNRWSSRATAKRLLRLLLGTFVPDGPVIIGIDETIERRWGPKIKARGIYRDPVRSSRGHFVKASGLRWISVMLLAPVPWAGRVWALPFLTALAPSERFAREQGCRHKELTDWARQLLLLLARWLPERRLIAVADSSYAAIELLAALCGRLTMITRLRLDARLFDPPPPRRPGTMGRPRVSGARQPTLAERLADPKTRWRRVTVAGWYGRTERQIELISGTALWYHPGKRVPIRWLLVRDVAGEFEPQGFLCTDQDADPLEVLRWFVRRWSVEVTFAEVRRHLGVESQRQWSDLAVARTTPALLGLFSLVTLWAEGMLDAGVLPRRAAWYPKPQPTFSDALAAVRYRLWTSATLSTSADQGEVAKIPRGMLERLTRVACFPA
ncbi:MAG TPA: transposase [Geminicoccaceae bacterium]|nr:transposase [Geminicoccaceae bacterium]